MKSFVFALLLTVSWPLSAQTWLHVAGLSWHDRPGFREVNTGIGIEQQFAPKWTWALGTYQNSVDRQSVYALTKYQWIQRSDMAVNVNIGGVTGYRTWAVAPAVLPEICWHWICTIGMPQVGNETTAAVAVYLRIPL